MEAESTNGNFGSHFGFQFKYSNLTHKSEFSHKPSLVYASSFSLQIHFEPSQALKVYRINEIGEDISGLQIIDNFQIHKDE